MAVEVFDDPPVLCGHRGSGAGDGENTLSSFRAAVEAGLRWVEVDARIGADDVLVASHDPLPAGATGLMPVADLLADLPLDVAVNVDVKTSLEDALRPRDRTTAALVADMVAGERRRLLVSSFDPAALLIVRERAPDVPIGLLTWTRFPLRKAIPAAAHLGADVVGPHVESFPLEDAARYVRVAHEAGLQVAVWCPVAEQREPLVAAGVDCLVVDDVLKIDTSR